MEHEASSALGNVRRGDGMGKRFTERWRGWLVTVLLSALAAVLMRTTTLGNDHNEGGLRFVEVLRDGVGGVDGLVRPEGIAISPDGAHVYVAAEGSNAVTAFTREPADGRLTLLQVQRDGLRDIAEAIPVAVTVSPDGANIYVVTFYGNAVAVFGRDPETGLLTFVEAQREGAAGVEGLVNAKSVVVSPEGHHVYTAAVESSAVAAFARDATTGALTFVETQRQGVGGVDGLLGAHSVAVSPDGAHVYVAGVYSSAVAVFARDPSTGRLTFVEAHRGGPGGVDGLAFAEAVAVSPDGSHVYAVSAANALVVFARQATSGRLTYVETHKDDCTTGAGSIGVCLGYAVAVSPDGASVYTVAWHGRALGRFARNVETGTLTSVEVQRQGEGDVDGLTEPFWVEVSPDGRHVYVASRGDEVGAPFDPVGNGAVAVFEVAAPSSDDDGCAIESTGGSRHPAALLSLPALLLAGGRLRRGRAVQRTRLGATSEFWLKNGSRFDPQRKA